MNRFLVLLAQLVAFWPELHGYYLRTRYASADRTHLVAAGAAAALVVIIARSDSTSRHEPMKLAAPALGVLLVTASRFFAPPVVPAFLAVVVLTGTASAAWTGRRMHLGLLGLGLLALPVVPMFGLHLGPPLRVAAASAAAALLRTGGLGVVSRGASLDWHGTLVLVDPPCSGLSMLWVGCFFALVGSSMLRLSNSRILVALALAIVASWGANVLRAAALFRSETGLFDLPAWGHEAVGLVTHSMVVLLIVVYLLRSRAPLSCASST